MIRYAHKRPLFLAAVVSTALLLGAGCHSPQTNGVTKLSATDQTAAEIAMAEAADANGLQAVLVHVKLSGLSGSLKEREQIRKLEDQLNQTLKRNGFDEIDGDEFAGQCVIYLYAFDADALYSCVQPALESCPLRKKIYAVKRYGPPGSREAMVELPQPVAPPERLPYAQPAETPNSLSPGAP